MAWPLAKIQRPAGICPLEPAANSVWRLFPSRTPSAASSLLSHMVHHAAPCSAAWTHTEPSVPWHPVTAGSLSCQSMCQSLTLYVPHAPSRTWRDSPKAVLACLGRESLPFTLEMGISPLLTSWWKAFQAFMTAQHVRGHTFTYLLQLFILETSYFHLY